VPSRADRKRTRKAAAIKRFRDTQAMAAMTPRPKLEHIATERIPPDPAAKVVPIRTYPILDQGVEKLAGHGVTSGMIEALKANGILTLSDLKGKPDEDILSLDGFGPGRLAKIKLAFGSLGIQ
jgi:hypothetical protein